MTLIRRWWLSRVRAERGPKSYHFETEKTLFVAGHLEKTLLKVRFRV